MRKKLFSQHVSVRNVMKLEHMRKYTHDHRSHKFRGELTEPIPYTLLISFSKQIADESLNSFRSLAPAFPFLLRSSIICVRGCLFRAVVMPPPTAHTDHSICVLYVPLVSFIHDLINFCFSHCLFIMSNGIFVVSYKRTLE